MGIVTTTRWTTRSSRRSGRRAAGYSAPLAILVCRSPYERAIWARASNGRSRRHALSSVESATLAGEGAALLFSLATYLLGRQPGVRSGSADLAWYADSGNRFTVFVGLNL